MKEVVGALEKFAPLPLQESYDNAGLQLGLTETEVSGALLCLDVTEKIVDEAIARDCNVIISHHPLIFHRLSHITGGNYVERAVAKAIKADIAIISMHTNLDNAQGGVSFMMAEKMGMSDVSFLCPPRSYSSGDDGPTVQYASGVIGSLPQPLPAADFITMLKRVFNVECVQANQLLRRDISRVALCGGAGSFAIDDALRKGADAFVTGEMHYHEYFGHDGELQIAVIGHYQSEQFTNQLFLNILHEALPELRCELTKTNTNPIIYL